MQKLLLAFTLLLLLTGCSKELPPTTENAIEPDTISESELFERKKECAKHIAIAKEKAEELTIKITDNAGKDAEFQKIFYSKVENSCLYTIYTRAHQNGIYRSITFSVFDALSGEEIYWTYGCEEITDSCDKSMLEGSNELRAFLREHE